jgi:hypothetical protein
MAAAGSGDAAAGGAGPLHPRAPRGGPPPRAGEVLGVAAMGSSYTGGGPPPRVPEVCAVLAGELTGGGATGRRAEGPSTTALRAAVPLPGGAGEVLAVVAAGGGAFAPGAVRLAGVAGALLGWSPDAFWRATPDELAAVVRALAGDDGVAPVDATTLARLREADPDG